MRTLIVGGLGFIGSSLARYTASIGWEVHVTTRRPQGSARAPECVSVHWRVYSPRDLEAHGFDVVYYMPGRPGGRLSSLRRVHVDLARAWAEWAAEQGAKYVYMSSIAVTADFSPDTDDKGRIIEEREHLGRRKPGQALTNHSRTKAEMETLLVTGEPGRLLRGRFTIARPGMVYGPGAPHLEWKLIRAALKLHIIPDSNLLPVISAGLLAQLLARIALDPGSNKAWINLLEEGKRLREAIENSFYKCNKCPTPRADSLSWLLRFTPRISRARLLYSLTRRKRRFSTKYKYYYKTS